VGDSVTICGWVDKYRNLGGLLFLDIRDHTGVIQVICDDSTSGVMGAIGDRLRQEWVVKVTGQLRQRQDVNKRMQTGAVEVVLSEIEVLNSVNRPLPFPVSQSDEKAPPRCSLHTQGV
jgi:aspartyl-tRNA synthetase